MFGSEVDSLEESNDDKSILAQIFQNAGVSFASLYSWITQ